MYNYNISYLLSKTSEEEISKIVSAAEFTARSIIAEIGEADREDLKVDEEPCHWRSLTRIIFELDIREASTFMSPTERYILFKRLRNVVRDDIRKSLNITRGKWDRFFLKWQKKAAQLLEISPTKKLKKSC